MGRGSRLLLLAWIIGVCAPNSSAFAYKKEYHFYLTQILASWCGFDRVQPDTTTPWTMTEKMAWATYSVDRFPETDPGAGLFSAGDISRVENRAVFHFPMSEEFPTVQPGSKESRRLLDGVLESTNVREDDEALLLFGIGLHRFEDSWAHAGFEPSLGHLFSGTAPDFPDHAPEQALEMNREVWKVLNRLSMRTRLLPCEKAWIEIEPTLKAWNSESIISIAKLSERWREHATVVTGRTIEPSKIIVPPRLERMFLEQADLAKRFILP